MAKKFYPPCKAIFNLDDLKEFQRSNTYESYLKFVKSSAEAVKGIGIESGKYHVSTLFQKFRQFFQEMENWIEEFPPLKQPMRFGNKAFCSWHRKLTQRVPEILQDILPKDLVDEGLIDELAIYFISSFGNEVRIDYGTGHETNFVVLLYILRTVNVIGEDDIVSMVLWCFNDYLKVMRRLHESYILEPAGSHGAWGLDDYHCVPFLWGSAQLIEHPTLVPASSTQKEKLVEVGDDWLYFGAVKFTWNLKKGVPFGECCPMLNDISLLPSWKKVYMGMLKLYEGEVLGKLPVVQHLYFGSVLKASWKVQPEAQNQNEETLAVTTDFNPYINCPAPWAIQESSRESFTPSEGDDNSSHEKVL